MRRSSGHQASSTYSTGDDFHKSQLQVLFASTPPGRCTNKKDQFNYVFEKKKSYCKSG